MDQIPLLNELPLNIRDTIIRIALAILAVVIIWMLRRALTWALIKPLRAIVQRSSSAIDDQLLDLLISPVRYIIIALGLLIAAGILGFDSSINILVQRLSRSLIIIALFLILYRLVDVVAPTTNALFAFTGISVQERLLPFARTTSKITIGALALVIVIQEWGYDVSGLIAGLGLFGLAFSLAAKDSAENLFGFMAIVADNPLNEGEFIQTTDVEGTIEHVGMRSTRVRKLDQSLVTIPNSRLAQSVVLNWSRLEKRRLSKTIGVMYDANSADIRLLVERIRALLLSREHVDPDSVVVNFVDFGESSLDILVIASILLSDWGDYTNEKEAILLQIMDIIAELNMSLAFPSRSLYIEQMPGMAQLQRPDIQGSLPQSPPPKVSDDYANLSNEPETGGEEEPIQE